MPTTIKLGDSGDDVRRLQRVFARIKVLGPDDIDGVFGSKTEQVVKDFQQSNGLVADGVVGPITWSHVGTVTLPADELKRVKTGCVSRCGNYSRPMRHRFGSEGPQGRAGDEMALQVEGVMDGGMEAEKALRGSG